MSGSRKILIVGSLALALFGMGYGLYYAVFTEHQTLDGLGAALATGFARAAERRMPESEAALSEAAQRSFDYVRQVDAHGHWIGLAILLLILGIGFDLVGFGEKARLLLSLALLSGAVLFPLGVLLETWSPGP
ncbi:MAG: hypothetical protein ACRD4K_11865, partial [Candidatus Acidiferrales bacterium]